MLSFNTHVLLDHPVYSRICMHICMYVCMHVCSYMSIVSFSWIANHMEPLQ